MSGVFIVLLQAVNLIAIFFPIGLNFSVNIPYVQSNLRWTFWIAVFLSIGLFLIPFGRFILYPFAFLSTWAHEMGHGLTSLLVGGKFDSLVIYKNLGGTAFIRPPLTTIGPVFISAGGLVGPAIAGGFIIVLGSRPRLAGLVAFILSLVLLVSAAVWVRNLFGFLIVLSLGLVFGLLSRYGSHLLRLLVTQFTGIQFCLGSLASLDYMFTSQFSRDGVLINSDTQNIAEHLMLPYWFWGGIIALISFLILAAAFYIAWIKPIRTRS